MKILSRRAVAIRAAFEPGTALCVMMSMMRNPSNLVPTRPPLGCAAVMMEVLRGELREHELPFTRQREIIAQVLFESTRHLSAEDVARELRQRGEHVGKATVYRTLALLVDLGLATEHDFDEGFKRYQTQVGAARHDHLICSACGKVIPFEHPRLEQVLAEIALEHDFQPITRQIKIFGTCHEQEACRELRDAYAAG